MDTNLHIRPLEHRAPALSPDGYIRMPLSSLNSLRFVHLYSDNDADFLDELRGQTIPARSAGFSEWKSSSEPSVSLGWGWFIHTPSQRMMLAPDGVRSNVMLIDLHGYDLGPMKTSSLFGIWLGTFNWQGDVSLALQETMAC
ncbi:hypothetical protein GCM10027343_35680 [Noviherbaspirillum agri]